MKKSRTLLSKLLATARDEGGFTIQELLVVMIVGAILISLSLSMYAFASKLFLSWQSKSEGRDAVERVMQQMVDDIQKSKSIYALTDTSLILKSINETDVAFSFGKGNIYRNGTPLLYQSGMTIAVKITRDAQDAGAVVRCLDVAIEGTIKNNIWKEAAVASILTSSRGDFTNGGL